MPKKPKMPAPLPPPAFTPAQASFSAVNPGGKTSGFFGGLFKKFNTRLAQGNSTAGKPTLLGGV